MGKRHNYASYTRPLTPPSVVKTKWELHLEELGLKDETAFHTSFTVPGGGRRNWSVCQLPVCLFVNKF
jgi:hypothetical protein